MQSPFWGQCLNKIIKAIESRHIYKTVCSGKFGTTSHVGKNVKFTPQNENLQLTVFLINTLYKYCTVRFLV